MTRHTDTNMSNHVPNPKLALGTIRLYLEQSRYNEALEVLKEYGKIYAGYALAEVEKSKA